MSPPDRSAPCVGIVGLGTIGGSLARDLAALGWRVLGADRDMAAFQAALDERVVAGVFPADGAAPAEMDAVVFAIPLDALPAALREAAAVLARAPLVMDVASTKRSAVAAAESAGIPDRFVGAHPMAGDHRSGWRASRRGMFVDANVYLCPTASTRPSALERARAMWTSVGARVEEIDAEAHDRVVARTSHLPQMVAKALALALADHAIGRQQLGTGGRDMTRIAGSDPDLWTAIAMDNADELLAAMDGLGVTLAAVRDALARRDAAALRALLARARDWS